MSDTLTLAAALLLGLVANGHCVLMCGGISTALGMATARNAKGKPQFRLLAAYQAGRVASYSLAGLLLAGALGGAIGLLDIESVRRTLRALSALAIGLTALLALGILRDPGARWGHTLWLKLMPLGRRLLPVATVPRAFAFGMIWGWMPCGFVYSVLIIATLQSGALRGAATMAAFGMGTAPALLAASVGAARFTRWTGSLAAKRVAAGLLAACALLTLAGPWLMSAVPGSHAWLPMHCQPTALSGRIPTG